ncbi:MAG: 5'-methylthioadenosine/S-adenosylhomocysteine nucleosidase [Candidatus Shapirobacteria bacterium]|jgi:5'-methylthioadenosine/S-adenosylhomocysteine nucleosidase
MKINKYKTIFLVAMGFEVENIFGVNEFKKVEDKTAFEIYEKGNMAVIKTGVSKTLAAAGTQWAVDNFETERWVNVGLCGSLNEKFDFGEVVAVSECRFHDLDVRGLTKECKIGQISPEMEYKYKLTTELVSDLNQGKCITGDLFVTDRSKFKEIMDEYSPDLVEMELTAIAQVMYVNEQIQKLSSLKVISDKANDNAGNDFDNIEEKLFEKIRKIIAEITLN